MKRWSKLLALGFLMVSACREEATLPGPVPLTAEAVGYFCQMNILDHGGPKAQVHLDGFPGRPLFFSQVRDAVFYLRMPERDGQVVAAYVTDMGSTPDWNMPARAAWVLAAKAVYVVGSDQSGGMEQPEFIPFADPDRARAFVAEHGGTVMRLDQIPGSALASPDVAAGAGDDADLAARLHNFTKTQGN